MAWKIVVVAAAFAVGMGGCADPSPDSPGDVRQLDLVPLPPIDGEGEPGQWGFGRITDLEIGADGSVFVLDGMNRTVRVFDDRGAPLGTFGSRGQGPGELERPAALAWGPGGNLWVVDPGNARFTVFDTEGRLVATHLAPDPYGFHPMAVGFSPAGLLRTVAVTLELGSLERPTTAWVESEVREDRLRELRRIDLSFVEQPSGFRHEGGGMVLMLEIPFSPEPVFGIDPRGRLWYADTGEPWVHRWSPSDGLEQAVGRELDPPGVTRPELREVLEREDVEELRSAAGPETVAEFTALIPDLKPHLRGFFFDGEENVWVIRTGEDGSGDATRTREMDVYDPDGALVAVAHVAVEPEPRPRIRDGLLAGVVRDELGTESVALYRIR